MAEIERERFKGANQSDSHHSAVVGQLAHYSPTTTTTVTEPRSAATAPQLLTIAGCKRVVAFAATACQPSTFASCALTAGAATDADAAGRRPITAAASATEAVIATTATTDRAATKSVRAAAATIAAVAAAVVVGRLRPIAIGGREGQQLTVTD